MSNFTIARNIISLASIALAINAWGQPPPRPYPIGMPPQIVQKLFGRTVRDLLLAQKTQTGKTLRSAASGSHCFPDCEELLAKARKNGSVQIIVTLDAPNLPQLTRPEAPNEERRRASQALRDAVARTQQDFLGKFSGYKMARMYKGLSSPDISMEVDAATLEAILSRPEVRSIEESRHFDFNLFNSGPLIGAPQAWNGGFTGSGYVVVILDTGVDRNHPFLSGKVVAEACFSGGDPGTTSVCPNGNNQQTGTDAARPCTLPGCDHGTHVAGIAAGNGVTAGKTYSGIAKDANIVAIQVASQVGSTAITTTQTDLNSALDYVINSLLPIYNVAAVNFSGGTALFDHVCDNEWSSTGTRITTLRAAKIATNDLRHTWASWLTQNGVPLNALQEMGAWQSAEMVRRYAHLAPEQFARHAQVVDRLIGGGTFAAQEVRPQQGNTTST